MGVRHHRNAQPHLIGMVERRFEARALRDAMNVGVVAFEKLGGTGGREQGTAHFSAEGQLETGDWGRIAQFCKGTSMRSEIGRHRGKSSVYL
jgi:hypothetical protein